MLVMVMLIGRNRLEVEQGVGGDVKIQGRPGLYRRVEL